MSAVARLASIVPVLVALGVASVLGAGCPTTIENNPDAGVPPGPQLQACENVEECPGFVEGAASQVVRCDGVCLTICNGVDEACPAQFFCETDNTCRVGCKISSECAEGELCSGGDCLVGSSECATKCDCQAGDVCIDGQCQSAGNTCDASADCPRGPRTPTDDCEAFQCNGFTNTCFDPTPTPCTASSECPGRPGCTGDAVCVCNAGACVPDGACTAATEANDCGPGNFCDASSACQALPACQSDAECTGFSLTCDEVQGKCARAQSCDASIDCTSAPNTFCADGFCAVPTCRNLGVTCNAATQDCSADGRCVARGTGTACQGNATCPADQFCNLALNPSQCATGCRDNSSCTGANQTCNGAHECVGGGGGGGQFGDPCTDDAECSAPMGCGFFTGTCAEQCSADADCIACAARNGSCTCGAIIDGFCAAD